jgi:GH24 family phage-related lysozyme (muramidase)
MLKEDVEATEEELSKMVAINTTDNEFSAMVCLAFNIGVTAFRNSTLLKMHNKSDHVSAANQFLVWCHAGNQVVPGLLRRRQSERDLYLS